MRRGTSWQTALGQQMESIKSAAVFVGESGLGPWRGVGKEILFIVKSGQIRQPSDVRLRRLIPVGTLLDAPAIRRNPIS